MGLGAVHLIGGATGGNVYYARNSHSKYILFSCTLQKLTLRGRCGLYGETFLRGWMSTKLALPM
jgi:hypothetical protein